MGFHVQNVLYRDSFNKTPGIGNRKTIRIHANQNPPQPRVISVGEGVHDRFTDGAFIKLRNRNTEHSHFHLLFRISNIHKIQKLFNGR